MTLKSFQNHWFLCSRARRGSTPFWSRRDACLLALIWFVPKIATLNISTSNLSLTESVGLRWRLIFVLLTIWLGCVFWDLGTGPGLKFYGVGARPMASPRLTWDSPFSIIKPQVPEASMTLKSFQNHCFYNAKVIEA